MSQTFRPRKNWCASLPTLLRRQQAHLWAAVHQEPRMGKETPVKHLRRPIRLTVQTQVAERRCDQALVLLWRPLQSYLKMP